MRNVFIFLAAFLFVNCARADCELNDLNAHRAQNYYCSMIYNLEKAQRYLCMEEYENAHTYYYLASCACFDDDGIYRFKIDVGLLLSKCMADEDYGRLSTGLTKIYYRQFGRSMGDRQYLENVCDR